VIDEPETSARLIAWYKTVCEYRPSERDGEYVMSKEFAKGERPDVHVRVEGKL